MRFSGAIALAGSLLFLSAVASTSAGCQRKSEQAPRSSAAQSLSSAVETQNASPGRKVRRSVPNVGEVIVLPSGVSLEDIRVVERDLIIALPDGSELVVEEGALFPPALEIGGVELPPENLAALLLDEEPRPAAGEVVHYVSTRLFVPARFTDFRPYGAVAMIAFPQAPATRQETSRYERICKAYVTILPDAIATRQQAPDLRQMVTIWPRRDVGVPSSVGALGPSAAAGICRRAVYTYAYPAAAAWLARVPRRAGLNRTNRGPFLVAWAPTSAFGKLDSALLIFDLSAFEDERGIQRAFRIWKAEIENDPKLWNKGWNVARWKAHTAAKLDSYGRQITTAITMVPWLKG